MLNGVTIPGDEEPGRLREELAAARDRLATIGPERELAERYRAGKVAGTLIEIDYPIKARAREFSSSPHMRRLTAKLDNRAGLFRERLAEIAAHYVGWLRDISVSPPSDARQPYWRNDWLPGLDAACIYGFLASRNPRTYFEVGSGNSTKFARRAIADHGLRTRIISVDPHPRAEVDEICDEMHRVGFEDFDLSHLGALETTDVVFIDNSHRSFSNSDVTVFFMEAIGRLPKGCLYGLHDIFLPHDYPAEWAEGRFYNEEYMLAAYLFGGGDGDDIHLPAHYASLKPEVLSALDGLWSLSPDMPAQGGAFWMSKG